MSRQFAGWVASLLLLCAIEVREGQAAPRARPGWPPPSTSMLAIEMRPTTLDIGTSAKVLLRFHKLPPNSGIVVSLVRAGGTGADVVNRYFGPLGPIHDQTLRLSGSGRTTVVWDASTVGCYPNDAPMRCRIEPGRYRLEGSIYPHGDFAAVPFLRARPPPLPIAHSYSQPIVVRGPPDLETLAFHIRGAASREVASLPSSRGYWMMGRRSDWFVDEGENFRRERRGWCMDFKPRPPLEGKLTACAPASAVSTEGLQIRDLSMSFSGRPMWPANVIQGTASWDAALALVPTAEPLGYLGWPTGATGLQQSIYAAHYRPDLRAWLVAI